MIIIDTIYQRVLALANKEQRGYITPLEFNLLANQAQDLIFEQYFYDLDQAKRRDTDTTSLSDMEELIENKLTEFTNVQTLGGGTTYPDNYRTGRIFVLDASTNMNYEAKHVEMNEIRNYLGSEFHMMGLRKSPIYHKSNIPGSDVEVYNHEGLVTIDVSCEIITRPEKAEWGYDVINERALYNASRSTNFQLHASEDTELVNKILGLAGIVINKPDLAQAGAALDNAKLSQEKQ
jgi:hypothetical protein